MTGATGLIGSSLLSLFGAEDEVHVIARAPAPSLKRANVRLHLADLGAPLKTDSLPGVVDHIFHLAQSESYRDFPAKARDIFTVNVANLLVLLDYAGSSGARSFVVASSGGVYGPASVEPVSEQMPTAPAHQLGFYLSSKLCGEVLAENYAALMNVAILRPFFAYGARQRRTMLIPRLIDNVRTGTPIQLQGIDGLRINPVHTEDAARAFKAAALLGGLNKINVAGPDAMTLRQICDLIGEQVGRKPNFDVQENSTAADLVADISAMSKLLGAPQRRFVDELGGLL